jgi:hypothetical protein
MVAGVEIGGDADGGRQGKALSAKDLVHSLDRAVGQDRAD